MNPSAAPSSNTHPDTTFQAAFRARLDAATMALLQTRDHVVRALDAHLAEMHALRHQLAEAEQQTAMASAPVAAPAYQPASVSTALPPPLPREPAPVHHIPAQPVAAVYDPPAPPPQAPLPPEPVLAALQGLQEALLQKVPVTPAPMPMSEVFPDRLPDFTDAAPPIASPFSLPPMQMPPQELAMPSRPLVAPAMPQQMMSFQTAFTTVAAEPTPPAPALSRPLAAQPALPPLPLVTQVTLPPPAVSSQRLPTPLPPARDMAREVAADPRMEQATLEDLNAALAFAFSQPAQQSRPFTGESAPVASRPLPPGPQWSLPSRS